MRWKISPHFPFGPAPHPGRRNHHDPRTVDLLAIVALLILILGSGWYLSKSLATPPSTTSFIVPSQSVHW
jgi:hypothetical protein